MNLSLSGRTRLLPVLIATALATTAYSGWRYTRADTRAESARDLLVECQSLTQEIAARQRGPVRVETDRRGEEELSRQIENWCRDSRINTSALTRIVPLPPRRIDESSYVAQGARVELRRVTLPQLAEFAGKLGEGVVDLTIRDMRLTAPAGELAADTDEVWQAEFALTYYVYSPKSSR